MPEPWDDILKQIRLPKDRGLAMDTKTGAVTVTLGQIGLDFRAFEIDGISLVYTRAAAKGGKSGITVELTGCLPGGSALAWDPATETPPEIPGKGGALTAGKDRYRQECLIEMGNFYEMASVAVLELKIALGGLDSPEPMNLFGQPVSGPGPKKAPPSTDNYSLTGGKAAMTPSGGPMAIGLFARNKTLSSTVTADLTFTIGAIEHDLAEIRIGETV